jgi:hypothetical protein
MKMHHTTKRIQIRASKLMMHYSYHVIGYDTCDITILVHMMMMMYYVNKVSISGYLIHCV